MGADHIVSHQCAILSDFSRSINNETIFDLIGAVSSAKICQGTFEERYITMAWIRKGTFTSQDGKIIAVLDESFCIMVDGKEYSATIRHTKCELLIDGNLCASCNSFQNVLRALFSKPKNRADTPSLFTNTRFLRTPQKSARIMSLQKAMWIKNRQLKQCEQNVR